MKLLERSFSAMICRRTVGGAMPARTYKSSVGAGRMQPVIGRHVSFNATSMFLQCTDLLHTRQQYSAVDTHSAIAVDFNVTGHAPKSVPLNLRSRLFLEASLAFVFLQCSRYVSVRPSVTPRYTGL